MNENSTLKLITGNKIPIIGFGTWQVNDEITKKVVRAIKMGFKMIDTSGNYGTQYGVGSAIRSSGKTRNELYLVTKIEHNEDGYEATRRDLEELQMTYANLMLIHWPPRGDIGKVQWDGLIRAREEGFTKDIGVSNYSIDQIQELIDKSGVTPAVNQIEWTPFGHSMEMLGFCQENGIIIQAYSPLTRGERLSDPYLKDMAKKYNKNPSQILLRWDIQLGVIPIVKASNMQHLAEDIDIFDFEISQSDMDALKSLNEEYSSIGTLAYLRR